MAELHRVFSDTDDTDRDMPSSPKQKGLDSNRYHITSHEDMATFGFTEAVRNSEHTLDFFYSRNSNFRQNFFFFKFTNSATYSTHPPLTLNLKLLNCPSIM